MKDDLFSRLQPVTHRIETGFRTSDPNNLLEKMKQEIQEGKQQERQKEIAKQKHDDDVLETLKGIERNTGDIAQIITLLQANNSNQEEMLGMLLDIQSIGFAKTPEEADSMYRKVMEKITQTFDDAEAIDKLVGLSRMFWTGVKAYLKSNGIDFGEK